MSTKKVLIIGGSGFIGTNLLDFYLNQGVESLNIDISVPRNSKHISYWNQVDILDTCKLTNEVKAFSPTDVFHLAARTDIEGKNLEDYATNIRGVENVITAISKLKSIRRIVFASTRLVCKIGYQPKNEYDYCPTHFYGQSKVIGEKLVRDSKKIPCSWIIVRPTSIWGPWFGQPYKLFFKAIAGGLYVHPWGREIKKSFGFVKNSVFQLDNLLAAPVEKVHGKTFYLADYIPIDVKDMAERVQKAIGMEKIRSCPLPLLRLVALCGDISKFAGWRNPPLTSFRLDNLLTEMIHDLSPLREITGELPYSLDEGIKMTIDWLYETGELKQV